MFVPEFAEADEFTEVTVRTNWRGHLTAPVVPLPLFASDDARDFLSCG
jgi:hypothetical protein